MRPGRRRGRAARLQRCDTPHAAAPHGRIYPAHSRFPGVQDGRTDTRGWHVVRPLCLADASRHQCPERSASHFCVNWARPGPGRRAGTGPARRPVRGRIPRARRRPGRRRSAHPDRPPRRVRRRRRTMTTHQRVRTSPSPPAPRRPHAGTSPRSPSSPRTRARCGSRAGQRPQKGLGWRPDVRRPVMPEDDEAPVRVTRCPCRRHAACAHRPAPDQPQSHRHPTHIDSKATARFYSSPGWNRSRSRHGLDHGRSFLSPRCADRRNVPAKGTSA